MAEGLLLCQWARIDPNPINLDYLGTAKALTCFGSPPATLSEKKEL